MADPFQNTHDLLARLRRCGHPMSIGGGRPFNPDGEEAAREIERLRAALVWAEIALNRDDDVENARRIIMEANHGKQS